MSINLVTYANQTVTPTNDAIIYERAIDQNGIFHGCNVTVSGNNVNITGGYGIVCGREFVIESESIPVTLAPSGTLDGRLYVRLDLADADAPIQLLTDQGNPLPALEQDTDVNYVNGAYEMELATFTVGVSALSDCVETFETIKGTKEGDAPELQPEFSWSSPWTAPYSGILVMRVQRQTDSSGDVTFYVKDATVGLYGIGALSTGTISANYQNTISFPVINGHIYETEYTSGVGSVTCRLYRIPSWGQ